MIKQYVKKPMVIEAVQLQISNCEAVIDWINENQQDIATLAPGKGITITTLEGAMLAEIGDYIIKGIKGEFYPCKPDIFEASYEEVAV